MNFDEALLEAKWEEENVEEEKRKRRFEQELKLEEARMEIKRELEKLCTAILEKVVVRPTRPYH